MATMIVKIEGAPGDVYEALGKLVDENGASFYTLLVDGEAVKVDEYDVHLAYEAHEAALYAHADETMSRFVALGGTMPAQVAAALDRIRAFEGG